MKKHSARIGFLLLIVLTLAACVPTRNVPAGQYLLVQNKIAFVDNSSEIDHEEISTFLKQKANRKQWGSYIRLRIFRLFNKGKDTKFKAWVKRTLGEEPVLYDSSLADQTAHQLRLYLHSQGYFNAAVERKAHFGKKYTVSGSTNKRVARVRYELNAGQPYVYRNIRFIIGDSTLKDFVFSDLGSSLVKKGDRYNEDQLVLERDRISMLLNASGYYYFTPDYIRFKVDTALMKHALDLTIEVGIGQPNQDMRADSALLKAQRRFTINNVYLHTDYDALRPDTEKSDTLKVKVKGRTRRHRDKTYYFIFHNGLKIKPKTLTQQIFVDTGDFYNLNDLDKSHKQLLGLKIFRYANLVMEEIPVQGDTGRLNLNIYLSRLPIQAIALENQVTNKGSNPGITLGVVYENRNTFRAAEILNFRLNGAVEFDPGTKEERALNKVPFLNTVEAGTELSLRIPKFLLPVRQERFSKNFRPKTNLGIGFNYQQRPYFTRYVSKASLGYEWTESATKTHLLTPLELNAVVIYPDSAFRALIDAFPDKIMQNTYKDHIISSMKYSFIYNTQQLGKNRDFMYFRGNVEVAGFLFWVYNSLRGKQGSYLLFNIPYSQFCRIDADYRYFKYFNEENSLASRIAVGFGIPLTTSHSLPYEKYFYLGGANSMRGWKFRSLGPGSYNEPDTLTTDKIGEISLELNLEYRFPIHKFFRGAVFADAGNIWLRKQNSLFPGGEFKINRFYREIALDAGLGLRVDFEYFLVRLDWAVPLKNPSLPEGSRWVFDDGNKLKVLWNIGVGYPF